MNAREIRQQAENEIFSEFEMSIDNKAAFLFALLANEGGVYKNKGEDTLYITVHDKRLALEIFYLIDEDNDHATIQLSKPQDKRKKEIDKIIFNSKATNFIFRRIGIDSSFFEKSEEKRIFPDWIREEESNAACFLRALFLSSGILYLPNSDDEEEGKHYRSMQFSLRDDFIADNTISLLNAFEIAASKLPLKRYRKVVIRSIESIANFVGYIGAPKTALTLFNYAIDVERKSAWAGRMNCEISNMQKTADNSAQTIIMIDYLIEKDALKLLPKEVVETAFLRKDNPLASLEELAALSKGSVGKSGINHRMRKLKQLYLKLKTEETDE